MRADAGATDGVTLRALPLLAVTVQRVSDEPHAQQPAEESPELLAVLTQALASPTVRRTRASRER